MKNSRTILICEDKTLEVNCYLQFASQLGLRAISVSNAQDAKALLAQRSFDFVLTDICLGNGEKGYQDGLDLIEHISCLRPETIIVAMSALPETELVANVLRRGASHFQRKPILNADEISIALSMATERMRLKREVYGDSRAPERSLGSARGSGSVLLSEREKDQIEMCVRSPQIPMCILGESGTGKNICAETLQKLRRERSQKTVPLARFQCSALDEIECARLVFGERLRAPDHEGRVVLPGLLERADGGVFILDEISRLPLGLQEMLLKPLADGRWLRVGESDEISAEFQLVCLSLIDLDLLEQKGKLLPEFRTLLSGQEIVLRPLRARKEDFPALVSMRLRSLGHEVDYHVLKPFCDALSVFYWRGNIRQLMKVLDVVIAIETEENEGRVVLEPSNIPIFPAMLAPKSEQDMEAPQTQEMPTAEQSRTSKSPTGLAYDVLLRTALNVDQSYYKTLDQVEHLILKNALVRHKQNVAQVSRCLDIPRSTLDLKRKKYGLD